MSNKIFVDPFDLMNTLDEVIDVFDRAGGIPFNNYNDFKETTLLRFLALCANNDIGFYYKKRFSLCDTQGPHDVEEFYKDEEEI